jgi:hypothetical protein
MQAQSSVSASYILHEHNRQRMVQMVARDKRMADDVSIIILDMLLPPAPGIMPQQFPASTLKVCIASRCVNLVIVSLCVLPASGEFCFCVLQVARA